VDVEVRGFKCFMKNVRRYGIPGVTEKHSGASKKADKKAGAREVDNRLIDRA
jgi:hypothetical protein